LKFASYVLPNSINRENCKGSDPRGLSALRVTSVWRLAFHSYG